MTGQEWTTECAARTKISEGCSNRMYLDSKSIPTIGIGFNLEREDARYALASIGANFDLIVKGEASLTDVQIDRLFAYSWSPIVVQARATLARGIFDTLSDARRYVVCDLTFNMGAGADGWGGFYGTQALINAGQAAKNKGDAKLAHISFSAACNHLRQSQWYEDVGPNRGGRNIAMMLNGGWVDPIGHGGV